VTFIVAAVPPPTLTGRSEYDAWDYPGVRPGVVILE
jgi:hypothetical protein